MLTLISLSKKNNIITDKNSIYNDNSEKNNSSDNSGNNDNVNKGYYVKITCTLDELGKLVNQETPTLSSLLSLR